MLYIRRFGILAGTFLAAIIGFAVHVNQTIGFEAWTGWHWAFVWRKVRDGEFNHAASLGVVAVVWLAVMIAIATVLILIFVRPYADYGRAKWGGMAAAKAANLLGKSGFVVGVLGRRLLRVSGLSVLVFGPTRTGKSAGVIIPSILLADDESMFIHDVKGELALITGGARERKGPVVIVNPQSPSSARWNPLSFAELPENEGDLGDLIETYWRFLIPESPGGESGSSAHFREGGRVFGVAATLLIIFRARSEDRQATFKEVLDWMTGVDAAGNEIDTRESESAAGSVDNIVTQLAAAIAEVRARKWPHRIEIGLARILRAAKEERSSLISTALGGLGPWLNTRIVNITSTSDFSVRNYRGSKPLTVYWVTNPVDAKTYAPVTGMHIEALYRCITQKYTKGERIVSLVIDEASFLPPLKVIADAPAIILGYGMRMMVAVQDVSQLVLRYGKAQYDAMIGNYGVKVAFSQNSLPTAKEMSEIVGKSTRYASSGSMRGGSMMDQGESFRSEGKNLIEPSEFMNLKFGQVVILPQYHVQTPLKVPSAFYMAQRRIRKLANLPLSERNADRLA